MILREDAPRFHEAVGYNTSAEFVAEHEGFFMAALRGVTVVHDAVICNTTHAITAMATKHSWHPPVEQINGNTIPSLLTKCSFLTYTST